MKISVTKNLISSIVYEIRFKAEPIIQEEDILSLDFHLEFVKVETTKGTFRVYYTDLSFEHIDF